MNTPSTPDIQEPLTRADAQRIALSIAYDAVCDARNALQGQTTEFNAESRQKIVFWLDEVAENLQRKMQRVGTF